MAKKYLRSPAPNTIPLAHLGRYPLYRIKIPSDFLDLLVGATLNNRYYVLSVIGRGGMSVVYKAKEINTGLIVAVKTLRTHSLTDEMVVKRFKREAELLSRLNHPRIVNLHDYGTSSRGQPYFVMDFLVGDNLVTVLKREDHLDVERFQDIFVQVCAAIEHAHKHGAIHRDIKPGNIMLTRRHRTNDYVKVVDFGIAKLAEEAQKLTRMGEVWGSPIYMSPEQCMGAALDARSDIYSLGIVMYEALTGKVPFLGRNYADTMGKQISETPPTFAQIRPDVKVPASMEAIVMRAIEKDAADRYQSLTEMRKDLEAALTAAPRKTTANMPSFSGNHGNKFDQQQNQNLQHNHPSQSNPGGQNRPGRTGNQLKPARDAVSPRASSNKIKPPPSVSQSKLNMRSATMQNLEKPMRSSSTRSRMDAAVINPNRVRNLILIAVGTLLGTGLLISLATNGPQVITVVANVLKQVIGGTDDSTATNPNQGGSPSTDSNNGPSPGQTEGAPQLDPQEALKNFLSPGGTVDPGASNTATSTDSSADPYSSVTGGDSSTDTSTDRSTDSSAAASSDTQSSSEPAQDDRER